MFNYLYASDRLQQFKQVLDNSAEKRINSDFRPISYLYDMLIWHKMLRGENRFYKLLSHSRQVLLVIIMVLLLGIFIFASIKRKPFGSRRIRIYVAAGAVGFAGMVLNVILIVIFQTLFGYIYSWIGVAIAFFMAGTALASSVVNRYLPELNVHRILLLLLLLTTMTCLLILPAASIISHLHSEMLYLFVVLFCGGLVGAAFPLLCRLYLLSTGQTNLGGIYAADLFGGSVGVLLISGLFVPVYGFWITLLMTAGICAFGFILMLK